MDVLPMRCTLIVSLLSLFITSVCAASTTAEEIEAILKADKAPIGVVFEIAEDFPDFLELAIPEVKKYADKLKKRFPKIQIAVVSHGSEMFVLKTEQQKKYAELHKNVKSLLDKDKIPLHVCGTYASWYQTSEEDFPAYVDVTPSAPVQLRQYEEVGYERILLEID